MSDHTLCTSSHETTEDLRQFTIGELLSLDIPAPEQLLGPWLTDAHLSMVYSASGIGKSFFSMSIALAVAGGGSFLDWPAPRGRKVLLVDGEMDLRDLKDRAALLMPKIGGSSEEIAKNLVLLPQQGQDLTTEFPDLATEEGQNRLLEIIGDLKPELVILDNFSTLCEVEDENAAASFNPVMKFMRRLKQDGISVLLVHHSRKDDKSWRGSQKISVIFNTIIHLQKPEGGPTLGDAGFCLTFEKFRGSSIGVRDLEVRLTTEGWTFSPLVTDELAEALRLLRTLQYPTQAALASALGWHTSKVSRLRAEAVRKGLITSDEWKSCLSAAREATDEADDDSL